MPIVTFLPSGRSVEVPAGTTVFEAALRAELPIASSCNAEFICGKCNVRVVRGADALSAQTDPERQLLRRENRPVTDRISCQTLVQGDCAITTSYW
jgi:ferredoxin, 2Fe-2S